MDGEITHIKCDREVTPDGKPLSCKYPAARFFIVKGQYLCRCERHHPIYTTEGMVPKLLIEEITRDEYIVGKVMES
jgi:hypothetical protein